MFAKPIKKKRVFRASKRHFPARRSKKGGGLIYSRDRRSPTPRRGAAPGILTEGAQRRRIIREMALIRCPECGQEVSDKADACIHCGCPLHTSESISKELVRVVFVRDYRFVTGVFKGFITIDGQAIGTLGSSGSVEGTATVGTHSILIETSNAAGWGLFGSAPKGGSQLVIYPGNKTVTVRVKARFGGTFDVVGIDRE